MGDIIVLTVLGIIAGLAIHRIRKKGTCDCGNKQCPHSGSSKK